MSGEAQAQLIIILAGAGAALYLVTRRQGEAAASERDARLAAQVAAQLQGSSQDGGGVDVPIDGAELLSSPLDALGFGALQALADYLPQGIEDLRDPASELRGGLRNLASAVGLGGNSSERRREARADFGIERGQREGVERHAARVYDAATRSNLDRWEIGQDGTFTGWYRTGSEANRFGGTQLTAHTIKPPGWAERPGAWGIEAAVRAFGRPVQAGRGPWVGTEFQRFDIPAFDPRNPLAPPQQTYYEALAWEKANAETFERQHPSGVTTTGPTRVTAGRGITLSGAPS